MSPRGFAVLAGATAIAVVLAAWAVVDRDLPGASAAGADRPVVAGLVDRLNEIGSIVVGSGDGRLTLARGDGGWSLVERGGYPVDAGKARDLALAVAGLQLVEAKTAVADRLPRLELEEPGPGAKSRRIELLDKAGQPMTALIVGKTKTGLYGGGRSGVYVRRAGEVQAWLAAGQIDVPTAAMDVIEREILSVQPNDLARITLGAGGPSPAVIAKPDAAAETFTLETPPPAGKQPDPEKLERLAGSLISLTMQEVRPAAEIPMPPEAPRARFETWDGLVVEARTVIRGEGDKAEHWVVFAAEAQTPLGPPAQAGAGQPTPSPVGERAAAMKRRLGPWAFQISDYLAERMVWKMDDLVAAPAGAS